MVPKCSHSIQVWVDLLYFYLLICCVILISSYSWDWKCRALRAAKKERKNVFLFTRLDRSIFFSFSFCFFHAGGFCSENIGSTLTKPKYCVLLIEELRARDRIEPRSQDWQASLSHRNDSDCLISYCCFPKIWLRLKRTHLENVLWTECRV